MSTDDRGCCRHCIDGCEGVSGIWVHAAQEQPAGETTPTAYAVWRDGGCPMCAQVERIAVDLRKRAANYRDTELIIATTEPQTPAMRESRQFFQGCAEALEWTLADIAGDHFSWISGDA